MSDLLSRAEAAAFLNVHVDTITRWRKSGRLIALRIPGDVTTYYRLEDVEALKTPRVVTDPEPSE